VHRSSLLETLDLEKKQTVSTKKTFKADIKKVRDERSTQKNNQ